MTSAMEYLKSLPVLFINVDGHDMRAHRFMTETAPYFREAYRVPAVPIHDIVAEANDFSARVRWSRENADPLGYFKKFPSIYTIANFDKPTKRAKEYAGTRSLVLSTLRAIESARIIMDTYGYDRVMLCDDDAAIRPQLIENMLGPDSLFTERPDILVWGGAYGSGGLYKDNQRFLEGEHARWRDITGKQGRFFSQAYEMSAAGLDAMEYAIRNHFHAVDLMWWYAFARVTTYTMQPAAFTQVGESVRVVKHNPRTREGATVR